MSQSTIVNIARLTPRERRFLLEVVAGKSGAQAYLAIAMRPGLTTEKCRAPASRMLAKIKCKIDWPQFLEQVDLGELRFIRELERKLKAMTTKFHEGKAVADVEDNGVQMRAVELLADLLSKRKAEVAISGKLEVETAAAMTPEERRDYLKAHASTLRKMLEEIAPETKEGTE